VVRKILPFILIVVAITGSVYSGVFAPRNPYTGNPYTFSLSGLVSYDEATDIIYVSLFLSHGALVSDWRSSHLLRCYYGGLEPPTLTLFWTGNYGLYVDSKFLNKFRGYVMIRPASLDMPGVFSYEVYDIIHRGE